MSDNFDISNTELLPMHRRRALQLALSGLGISGVGYGIGTARGAKDGFTDVLSVDPSAYPAVGLNIHVDTEVGRDGRLTRDDFQLSEGGEPRELTDFRFSSTKLDLVFVFDDSGSLDDEIEAVRSESRQLTDQIAKSGIDARYGLVSYRDTVDRDLALTADADKLRTTLDNLTADGGGDFAEDNFDALETALMLNFREDAQKVFVDITDAISHFRGDGSGFSEFTLSEVATDIREAGVAYIAVSPGFDPGRYPGQTKQELADKTGGLFIDIGTVDFDQILRQITELVVSTYILEYETQVPAGTSAPIGVSVTDPVAGTDRAESMVAVPDDAGPDLPPMFTQMRDRKLDLATQIDDVGQSLNEQPEVEATLTSLANRITDDGIEPEVATEAIKRLILGENVTQAALGGLGPSDAEDFAADKFDGNLSTPDDIEDFDTGKLAVNGVTATFVTILLHLTTLQRIEDILPLGLGSRLADARKALRSRADDLIKSLLGDFETVVTRLRGEGSTIADDAGKKLVEAGRGAATGVGKNILSEISEFDKAVSGVLTGVFETSYPGGIEDALTSLNTAAGADGSVDVGGSSAEAMDAGQAGINDLNDQFQGAEDAFDALDLVNKIIAVLEIVGLILAASGVLAIGAAAIGAAGTVVATLFNLTKTVIGFGTLVAAVDEHREALDAIAGANGGEGGV